MAKSQNTFEKRRREMDKKQKADEKRVRRRARKESGDAPVETVVEQDEPEEDVGENLDPL